jgi:hypothetical protein
LTLPRGVVCGTQERTLEDDLDDLHILLSILHTVLNSPSRRVSVDVSCLAGASTHVANLRARAAQIRRHAARLGLSRLDVGMARVWDCLDGWPW